MQKTLITNDQIEAGLRKVGFEVTPRDVRQVKQLLEKRGFDTEVDMVAVASARVAIDAGSIETPERIEQVVDGLLADLAS